MQKRLIIALMVCAPLLVVAASAYASYTQYVEAPHVHTENGQLTVYGQTITGNWYYNYQYNIHARAAPGECLQSVEWATEIGYANDSWLNISRYQLPEGQCVTELGQDGQYGFGYGSHAPAGEHYHYVKVTDTSGSYAVAVQEYTLP